MSLEFMDGFDHYNNAANMQRKWDSSSNVYSFSPGRFGGNCAQLNSSIGAVKTLTSIPTRMMGFAYYGATIANGIIAVFQDSGTYQLELRLTTAGQLQVTRNGTLLGISASSTPLAVNTWYYIEWQATIDPIAGAYSVRVTVGGVMSTWISGTGQNTRNTANSSSNQVMICGIGAPLASFDDLYVLNPSGSVNNTFLGESRIITSLPSADSGAPGTNLLWTPDSGTAHFSRVNDSPNPDDDTSYVYSATAGQLDTYKYPAVTLTGAISGVQVTLCERKDNTGARTTAVEYRSSGGTNYTGANNFSPGSGYSMDRQIYETDPATSAAWTAAGINGGEFGINLVA